MHQLLIRTSRRRCVYHMQCVSATARWTQALHLAAKVRRTQTQSLRACRAGMVKSMLWSGSSVTILSTVSWSSGLDIHMSIIRGSHYRLSRSLLLTTHILNVRGRRLGATSLHLAARVRRTQTQILRACRAGMVKSMLWSGWKTISRVP